MPLRRNRDYFGKRKKPTQSQRRANYRSAMHQRLQMASPMEEDFHIENPINVQPAITRIFSWCFNILPITFNYARSIFSSSCNLEARLDSTQSELQEAKRQLEYLSKQLKCLENRVDQFKQQKTEQTSSSNPIPVAPVPPPPPPPPPVVKPLPTIRKCNRPGAVKCQKTVENETKGLTISLDDILNVKLKKREDPVVDNKENEISSKIPRITLADITSVALKTRNQESNEADLPSTPKSVLLTRALRKTGMKRSPGGTPIVSKDLTLTTATGPTPEIERALRRKFRSIRTSPLVEEVTLRSPR